MHTNANQRRQTWRRRVEPWYVAYGLLGATLGGLVPILIPLTVGRAGDVLDVGLVMAARWGYHTPLGLGVAGVTLALVLSIQIRPVRTESPPASD